MAVSNQIAELRRQLADDKGHAVRRALSTADGRIMLQALEERFVDGDLLGDSDRETLFNLGAREVVMYLRSLARLSELTEKGR